MSKFDPLRPLQDVTPRFTEEQLQQLVEWFDETARPVLQVNDEPTDVVTVGQVQRFLALRKFHRRSFHYPNFPEIMRELEHLQMAELKLMNKDQFIYVMDKFVREPDMKHELKLAFKVFDLEDRNFLEYEELRDIVTTLGDPFDAAETIEFLREANVRGVGNIFYNDFADDIFNLSPELYNVVPKEYLYEDADQDPSVPPPPPEEIVPVEPLSGPIPTPEIDQPTIETPSSKAPEASESKADVAAHPPPEVAMENTEIPEVATEIPEVGTETPEVATETPVVATETPVVATETPLVTTETTESQATIDVDVSTPKSEATEPAPQTVS